MGLPQQESKDTYTYDEVQHIVARQVMQHRLTDLEGKISVNETNVASMFAKLEATVQTLLAQLEKQTFLVKECRDDFKSEIDREYATKLEVSKLEAKVDKMWAKITVAVTLAVGFVQIALSFLGII